jgi:hypothetical protein
MILCGHCIPRTEDTIVLNLVVSGGTGNRLERRFDDNGARLALATSLSCQETRGLKVERGNELVSKRCKLPIVDSRTPPAITITSYQLTFLFPSFDIGMCGVTSDILAFSVTRGVVLHILLLLITVSR